MYSTGQGGVAHGADDTVTSLSEAKHAGGSARPFTLLANHGHWGLLL